MRYKSYFIIVSILFILSCDNTKNLKENHNSLNLVFNKHSIKLIKDSTSFGKMDDVIEIKTDLHKSIFKVNKVDSIIIIDTNSYELSLKIYSKKHNSKSINETLLILNTSNNSYYSFSTYNKYKPTGYPINTKATLEKNINNIVMKLSNDNRKSIYKFNPNENNDSMFNRLTWNLSTKHGLDNFFIVKKGNFFIPANNYIDIIVN